jgi:hypothetical protein
VLVVSLAQEIASGFDWDAERRRFENCADGEEAYPPCIQFTDDAFRTLEFGPNSEDRSFWVAYRYPIMRSTFGFHPIHGEEEQQLLECGLPDALALLEMFYRRAHHELTATLPPPPPFSTINLEREPE